MAQAEIDGYLGAATLTPNERSLDGHKQEDLRFVMLRVGKRSVAAAVSEEALS